MKSLSRYASSFTFWNEIVRNGDNSVIVSGTQLFMVTTYYAIALKPDNIMIVGIILLYKAIEMKQ